MIELRDIQKQYKMGENIVHALRGVSLQIESGDFVAIMGPSGSGKSTLMHVMGLLDVPDSGSYKFNQREISNYTEDELAVLRRKVIGFIFQQFNLLPRMTATENVAMPLLYSENRLDFERATELLKKVGLGQRLEHHSNEMSGGQQQRVAIARALVNQPDVIFADEPTGNLDSVSQDEIMNLLKELNGNGITIVVVTHEEEVGQQAKRVIRMRDGRIVSDERLEALNASANNRNIEFPERQDGSLAQHIVQHFSQGIRTLAANKIRTGLSVLGILIGVAAVVAMIALGRGAQTAIEQQLASLGSNLLSVRAGAARVMGGAMAEAGSVSRLSFEDAGAIRDTLSDVKDSAPIVNGRGQVTYLNKNRNTMVTGVSASYARMRADMPPVGRFFSTEEVQRRSRVAIIGATIVREVFSGENPIGEYLKINKVNFQVIGVLPEKGASTFQDQDDRILIPVTTAMRRLFGKDYVDSIDVEVSAPEKTEQVQAAILKLLLSRHKVPISQKEDAFTVRNMAEIQAALSASTQTMTILLSVIAAISLLVGGIGIMNIMLVSVTERTREIGLRKAVGARRADILMQFLAESVVISLVGGTLGILLAWLVTVLLSLLAGWATSITLSSVLVAVIFSATVGVVFGLYPARKAALLPPIDALRYE